MVAYGYACVLSGSSQGLVAILQADYLEGGEQDVEWNIECVFDGGDIYFGQYIPLTFDRSCDDREIVEG